LLSFAYFPQKILQIMGSLFLNLSPMTTTSWVVHLPNGMDELWLDVSGNVWEWMVQRSPHLERLMFAQRGAYRIASDDTQVLPMDPAKNHCIERLWQWARICEQAKNVLIAQDVEYEFTFKDILHGLGWQNALTTNDAGVVQMLTNAMLLSSQPTLTTATWYFLRGKQRIWRPLYCMTEIGRVAAFVAHMWFNGVDMNFLGNDIRNLPSKVASSQQHQF
jgi:hypothetical protein